MEWTEVLDACGTIIPALFMDWQSTVLAIHQYGIGIELNPLVRSIGPDAYNLPILIYAIRHCQDSPAWLTLWTWAVQTYAMGTHLALGTADKVPMLLFTWRW